MKSQSRIPVLCALVASTITIVGCTGDSLQPTASKTAYTPGEITTRPISDFIASQGTYCAPGQNGECVQYVAPTANLVYFYDNRQDRMLFVDYAGLAARWLRQQGAPSIEHEISGGIVEEKMEDGSALLTISFTANNVLSYAVQTPDLATGPLLFGQRVQDMVNPTMPAAMGQVHMKIQIMNPAPGMPIPDLMQIIRDPKGIQRLMRFTVRYEGQGTMVGGEQASIYAMTSGPLMPAFPRDATMSPAVALVNMNITPM